MRRNATIALLLLALALIASIFTMPWKAWLETQMKQQLVARGLTEIDFHLERVGLRSMTLGDLSFGRIKLQSLTLDYTPMELLRGNLQTLQAGDIALKQGEMEVALASVEADIPPARSEDWNGKWRIPAIRVTGAPVALPPLSAEGTLKKQNAVFSLQGNLKSADNRYKASFSFRYDLEHSEKASLTVMALSLPWNGGNVRVRNVFLPIFSSQPVRLNVELQQVSLDALLKQATGERASATGTVSGSVPVIVARDGGFTLGKGQLQASDAGTIALKPDAIPGDNAQVEVVRSVMSNFHYSDFTLTVDNDQANKLSMLLSLQGNNPDAYNGRTVKLNVHLTGDLLELLQQSVLPLNDPQLLLKQEPNATH